MRWITLRRLWPIVIICVFMAFLSVLGVYGYHYRGLFTPLNTQNPVIIEVPPNTAAIQLVQRIRAVQYDLESSALLAYMRWYGYTQHIQAGVYEWLPGEPVAHLIQRIVKGDVLIQTFRITEGTTLEKLQTDLQNAPYMSFHEGDLALFAKQFPTPEGLFLADSYQYPARASATLVLKKANQLLWAYLEKAYAARSLDLPYRSPYELLIAASIVEKETARADERRLIAGIIVNRLRLKMPLQMDPTVIYGLYKNYGHILTSSDLLVENPYNTYKIRGLPPTPIAFVGRDAIDAVAHPTASVYLYYVANGDGTHHFSKTYQEQRAAIREIKRSKK